MTTSYRVVVLGSGEVGKTALLKRCIGEDFQASYMHTIEDTYSINMRYDSLFVKLEIIDTDGEGDDSTTRFMYYTHGDGFIIVYDVTNRESFLNINKTYQQIRAARCMDTSMSLPLVIIANKSDVSRDRAVQQGEGETLARTLNAAYIETSAKYSTNVDGVFAALITVIRDQTKIPVRKVRKQSSCSCM